MNIIFDTKAKGDWIASIASYSNDINQKSSIENQVAIEFKNINEDDVDPFHLVTFACLAQLLTNKGCRIDVTTDSPTLYEFMATKTKFDSYFKNNHSHTPSIANEIFNLWRIADDEKEIFGRRVHEYFQQHYFKDKDLSAIEISLLEIYYNIFDHANANGNAFSFIKYCPKKEKLKIAICDFGDGIAATIRRKFADIKTDADAIAKSLEEGVTTQSRPHNAGMGLSNIRSACGETEYLRIVSNNGLVLANDKVVKCFNTNISFNGTLIYYELSPNSFDDIEILSSFAIS